ncbi:hypothetical protein [Leptospira sp. 'Mane']|uniref:hypothetical protein n=1 Tax=Leptospira sp. 'Mane' TaxID=3387407 RepID=UPI00398B2607
MYFYLIFFHSAFRWLVLISLLYSILRAYKGYTLNQPYTDFDNTIRSWTTTISHIQLILGFSLYFKSPLVQSFFADLSKNLLDIHLLFFGIIHIFLMTFSVILITIGSALIKRKSNEKAKFRTTFIWFSTALLIIFIAIPWPFSPFVYRSYLRGFEL